MKVQNRKKRKHKIKVSRDWIGLASSGQWSPACPIAADNSFMFAQLDNLKVKIDNKFKYKNI